MAVEFFRTFSDYDRQAAEARRRRAMADLLAQQVVEPTDYGRGPIPAAAPLVQGLQSFLAARAAKKASEAEEGVAATTARTGEQIAGRLTGGAPVRDIAPPDGSGLDEVAVTSQYKASPEDAFRLALSPAGAAATRGNPMLAAMLARSMEKPASRLQVGAIDPSKFTPQSLAAAMQSGDVSKLEPRDEGKAPTVAGGMMWSAEQNKFVPIEGYAEQQERIARAKRPDVMVTGGRERERLVSVIGSDGKPKFVRESEAEGMMPFTARTAADLAADETREQGKRNSAFETNQSLQFLADLIKHPGRKAATGASHVLGRIPGTEARGFVAKLDTFKSQMFLPAVKALQGMGALSNAEGMKLTDAIGALNVEMEEKELESEMRRIGNYLFDKAQVAGLDVALPPEFGKRAATSPPPGFELE